MERDVIVVGGGPAGATAAMALARAGVDVLLIDRAAFPRDKICGDAVPGGAFDILTDYGMQPNVDAAVARGEFYRVDGMRLVSPNGTEVTTTFDKSAHGHDSYIAPRIFFDNTCFQHAVDSGAEFRQGQAKEPIVEDGRVVGVRGRFGSSNEDLRARLVIAADGVTSAIARRLRPDKHEKFHRAIALRAYIEDLEELPHICEFFLYEGILPGYAWIFPTGTNQANIGLGMRIDKFERANEKLEAMLTRFMQFPEIKRRLKRGGELRDVATWQLNFGSQRIQRAYDGAMLIGDAGGYINPLTGGGIHNAIISAKIAAETALKALASGDTSRAALAECETRTDAELWAGMRRSYNMQRMLMRFPFVINLLVGYMGGNSRFAKTFLEKL